MLVILLPCSIKLFTFADIDVGKVTSVKIRVEKTSLYDQYWILEKVKTVAKKQRRTYLDSTHVLSRGCAHAQERYIAVANRVTLGR